MLGHNKDMHRFGSAGPRLCRCCSRSETPGLRRGSRTVCPSSILQPICFQKSGISEMFCFRGFVTGVHDSRMIPGLLVLNKTHESNGFSVVELQVKLANAATLLQPNEGKSQDVELSLASWFWTLETFKTIFTTIFSYVLRLERPGYVVFSLLRFSLDQPVFWLKHIRDIKALFGAELHSKIINY